MKRFLSALAGIAMLCAFGSVATAAPRVDDMAPIVQVKKVKVKKANAHKTVKIKTAANTKRGNGKTAVLIQGLMGGALAPMNDVAADLRAKGYRVRSTSFYAPNLRGADVVMGHSMGIFPALKSCADIVITIDIPFWAAKQKGCKNSRIANFYTLGHPQVYGAINVPIRANHLTAPTAAKKYIMSLV